jgi:2'-5' RNA ligase
MANLIPEDSVPPHGFHTGYNGKCLICNGQPGGPIHEDWLDNQTPEFTSKLVDNLPDEDYGKSEYSSDGDDDEEETHSGVMIALMVDPSVADILAIPGGEPANNMHVTLAYLGDAVDLQNPDDLISTVKQFATDEGKPLSGKVNGLGLFTGGETTVTYANADVPGLPVLRQQLLQVLDAAGFIVDNSHGFTPHITLAFSDERNIDVPNLPLEFTTMTVAIAGKKTTFPLGESPEVSGVHKKHKYKHPVGEPLKEHRESFVGFPMAAQYPPCADCGGAKDSDDHIPDNDVDDTAVSGMPEPASAGSSTLQKFTTGYLQVVDRQPIITPKPEVQTAFISEVNGHTLLTGPAHVDNIWEKALTPNQHMMWLQGRLVGADEANRNKAYWSSDDLEFGEPTVSHGPLNWLHESRHIIGAIADQQLIHAPERSSTTKSLPTHVAAVAGIWKWIYPDEAYVVEQASDQGRLYFSMECISENVECIGDNGCGEKASYSDYLKGRGCQHMREKSAVRRFENPTFLGAAVIVPPVRPGWADADARIIREAASLAEVAFEKVNPDMAATEWEALMRQVVGYAHTI